MFGTIRLNLVVAGVAFAITFLLSVGNNLFVTTVIHSLYSFIILFVLTFGFRWILGTIGGFSINLQDDIGQQSQAEGVGQQLDLVTPDEDDAARQQSKDSPKVSAHADSLFSPLNPPKLATKNNLDPEQLAGALRRMSED
jgi:hypothetical protein